MADANGGARAVLGRPWQLWVAATLLAGVLVTSIGETISAFGAPKIGVVDDWGRIDEAAAQIAAWPYLLVLVVAIILLHALTDGAQGLWLAAGIELVLFIAGCILGIVALSKRLADEPKPGDMARGYHTDGEVTGETITYVALILVALALIGIVLQRLRSEDVTVEQDPAT